MRASVLILLGATSWWYTSDGRAQPVTDGGNAESAVGTVGQRQDASEAAKAGVAPTSRINNRLENRVESRIENRIDKEYRGGTTGTAAVAEAVQRSRRAQKPR
jgi:hypothetical protein